jgi:hypothetical protein
VLGSLLDTWYFTRVNFVVGDHFSIELNGIPEPLSYALYDTLAKGRKEKWSKEDGAVTAMTFIVNEYPALFSDTPKNDVVRLNVWSGQILNWYNKGAVRLDHVEGFRKAVSEALSA